LDLTQANFLIKELQSPAMFWEKLKVEKYDAADEPTFRLFK
jgi:hypothetical protein